MFPGSTDDSLFQERGGICAYKHNLWLPYNVWHDIRVVVIPHLSHPVMLGMDWSGFGQLQGI